MTWDTPVSKLKPGTGEAAEALAATADDPGSGTCIRQITDSPEL